MLQVSSFYTRAYQVSSISGLVTGILELSECSQHKGSTKTELESHIILDSRTQVYPFYIFLYP